MSFFAGLVVGAGFGLMLLACVLYMWSRRHRLNTKRRKSQFVSAFALVLGSSWLAWIVSTVGPLIRSRLDSAFTLFGMMFFISGCIVALGMVSAKGLDKRGRNVLNRSSWFIFGLGLTGMAWMMYLRSVPGSRDDAMILDTYPVHNKWHVIFGGRTQFTNYYAARDGSDAPHRYGITLIQTDEALNKENDRQIISPLEGHVVDAASLSIRDSGTLGIRNAKGQILVIRNIAPKARPETAVKPGDAVGMAKTFGWSHNRAGISIHAEKEGKPVPILIGPDRRFLIRGDIIDGQ